MSNGQNIAPLESWQIAVWAGVEPVFGMMDMHGQSVYGLTTRPPSDGNSYMRTNHFAIDHTKAYRFEMDYMLERDIPDEEAVGGSQLVLGVFFYKNGETQNEPDYYGRVYNAVTGEFILSNQLGFLIYQIYSTDWIRTRTYLIPYEDDVTKYTNRELNNVLLLQMPPIEPDEITFVISNVPVFGEHQITRFANSVLATVDNDVPLPLTERMYQQKQIQLDLNMHMYEQKQTELALDIQIIKPSNELILQLNPQIYKRSEIALALNQYIFEPADVSIGRVSLRGNLDMPYQDQHVQMIQGDTRILIVSVDNVEDYFNVSMKWGVRKYYHSKSNLLLKTNDNGISVIDGKLYIVLTPSDTEALEGRYYHELELTDGNGNVSTVLMGKLKIKPSGVK